MLGRASLGHMHKLSHGPAEVWEESYYGLGTRTTYESTINPKSKRELPLIGPTWYAESDNRTY